MSINSISNSAMVPGSGPSVSAANPTTREEAAKTFEAHLVRQLVTVMFEGVFENGLSGEDGGVASVGRDEQRDVLVNELTELLTNQGGLGLADAMMSQWDIQYGETPEPENETALTALNLLR